MTDGSVVLAVLRLLVSLAVVLVLLVALARWASKRGIGSVRPGKATVDVDVLTRRSLGRNSTLQVVKVGSQVMVLGVTERGVSVLGELGDEDLVTAAPPLSVVPSIDPSAPASVPSLMATVIPAALRRVLGLPAPHVGAAAVTSFAPAATPATVTPIGAAAPAATVTSIGTVAPAPVVAAAPAPAGLVTVTPIADPAYATAGLATVTPIADPASAATPEAAAFLAALAAAPALAPSTAPFVWPDEDLAAVPMPPADPSPTYAIAESRALALAGFAAPTQPIAQPTATQPVAQPVFETRAAAREARRGARHAAPAARRSPARRQSLPGTQPRQSRTIVPVDSRSARRTERYAAEVPTGWPWNAAALVLSVGRGRRG